MVIHRESLKMKKICTTSNVKSIMVIDMSMFYDNDPHKKREQLRKKREFDQHRMSIEKLK